MECNSTGCCLLRTVTFGANLFLSLGVLFQLLCLHSVSSSLYVLAAPHGFGPFTIKDERLQKRTQSLAYLRSGEDVRTHVACRQHTAKRQEVGQTK